MARQIFIPRFLLHTALCVSLSYEAALQPEPAGAGAPTRKFITLYGGEEKLETAIGYVQQPEDGQIRVVDVSWVHYPTKDHEGIAFFALFDEEALRDFNTEHMKDFRQLDPSKGVSAASLKRHLKSSLAFLPGPEYTSNLTPISKFFTGSWATSWSEEASLLSAFYLSRPKVDQAFRLTAVYANLSTTSNRLIRDMKPRLNVTRLYDLLFNAQEAAPRPGRWWWREGTSETLARQLMAYSNYVSEARDDMTALDIWPASSSDSVTEDGLVLVDLLHWLMITEPYTRADQFQARRANSLANFAEVLKTMVKETEGITITQTHWSQVLQNQSLSHLPEGERQMQRSILRMGKAMEASTRATQKTVAELARLTTAGLFRRPDGKGKGGGGGQVVCYNCATVTVARSVTMQAAARLPAPMAPRRSLLIDGAIPSLPRKGKGGVKKFLLSLIHRRIDLQNCMIS
ncbi:hypothetical protein FOZ60_007080 [Perkinsus olseni]|uniref:Uncharacterized protein n=1 Tax=Perkinsus olseni TaxID=32597 RepID=A0A7J6NPJ6_PEROL|nr:hypothetical protein FOZ60_007080 [Perkinsus olseni]